VGGCDDDVDGGFAACGDFAAGPSGLPIVAGGFIALVAAG
jgi:hypothetical protein